MPAMKPLAVDVCCGEERWAAGGESALATSAPNTQQRPESRCLEAGWIVRDGGQQQQQHSKNWWSLGNHFVRISLLPNCRLPHSAWRRAYVYLCLFLSRPPSQKAARDIQFSSVGDIGYKVVAYVYRFSYTTFVGAVVVI